MDKLAQAFKQGFRKEAEREFAPSWWEGQKAQYRAMRSGDEGLSKAVADIDLIGSRLKNQLGYAAGGAGIGSALGALGGTIGGAPKAGALVGGLGGALAGQLTGSVAADQAYLDDRGITSRVLGMGTPKLSEEAQRKYLSQQQ